MTNPTSLQLLFGYMRAFEVACLTGDWTVLDVHFSETARHRIQDGGPFGTGGVGRAALIAGLRAGVDGVDRRFDLRIPEVTEGPQIRGDGVWMRFALTLPAPESRTCGSKGHTTRCGAAAGSRPWTSGSIRARRRRCGHTSSNGTSA